MLQGELEGSPCGSEIRENLMAMTSFCNKTIGEEVILRRSLFKTRCKMAGKCCKVIVDRGSLANLELEELVTSNCKFWRILNSIMFMDQGWIKYVGKWSMCNEIQD